MELVTGRAGSPHITAQQDRQLHQGIWGEEAYILNTGNMLEPEVQSSNKILIKDGALMFQGALFSVKVGTTDEITINNGNQGMQRKDLVVARYKYDSSQNIESAEWVVIQGEPAASNPVAPEGTSGDIQAGDATVDCPFMVVNLDGINVTGVDIIPEKIPTLPDLIDDIYSKKVLWSHAGMFLNEGQSINLSEKLSDQKRGIVLVLSRYESGASQDYGYCTYFVPKECLDFGVGNPGFDIPLVKYSDGSIVTGSKYIYVSDNKINGAATNGTSPNSGWVFRYAIGV